MNGINGCYGSPWTTLDEKKYLDRIGEHNDKWSSLGHMDRVKRKISQLKGYLKGCQRRKVWGSISKAQARAYAEEMLGKIKKLIR